MLILVTGGNGFVGKVLCSELEKRSQDYVVVTRTIKGPKSKDNNQIEVGSIDSNTNWDKVLSGVDTIIHLAARVHIMHDKNSNPLRAYREVNTCGTETLAKSAVAAGVRRFIYISTIKVNGEQTFLHANGSAKKFSECDEPNPTDPYATSKFEAEKLLTTLGKSAGLEVVIIRPPLVYGPNVQANFLRLLEFVYKGTPLPLGSVHNLRSLVSVFNFVDLIIRCIDHPKAKGETFLVSDGCDTSTPDLLAEICKAMHKNCKIFPVPLTLLKLFGLVSGKLPEINRLCRSLQVDISKANAMLDWTPPISLEEGIRRTVEWYQDQT